MKRSESQSLYKALPGQYLSYDFSPAERARLAWGKAVVKIAYWNKKEIGSDEIYKPKIVNQVYSNMLDFIRAEQDEQGASIDIDGALRTLVEDGYKSRVRLVEAKADERGLINREETAQIFGHINPKMFYCSKCGRIKILKKDDDLKEMYCHNHKMEQYERVWVCGCGETFPIDDFDIKEGDRYFASEPDGVTGANKQRRRLQRMCPKCRTYMMMANATDGQAFYPRSITTVKLYDNNFAKLCECDEGCKLILDKHKNEISEEDFKRESRRILEAESNREDGQSFDVTESSDVLQQLLGNLSIIKPGAKEPVADMEIVYKVLEYDTLVNKKVIDLLGAAEKAVKLNRIANEECVLELADKMHIKDIYTVSDIEVFDTVYGYTRRYLSPEGKANSTDRLKLCAFKEKDQPGVPIFYNVRTKTEGVVIDIDPKRMYRYVYGLLSENHRMKRLKEESEIQDWFLDKNNIDPDLVKTFSSIEEDGTQRAAATKIVYNVLHTISHAAIQAISKYSGIDKDSLTEMVFPNLCSILVYASTNQAIVLGAITSMFDKQIKDLLESIYEDTKICSFDPVCINDTGSCLACLFVSEAACEHFNKDLSRRYLYGYHGQKENIIGFWEDFDNGDNASE